MNKFNIKKFTLVLSSALLLAVGLSAQASEPLLGITDMDPQALLKWKVGDSADYEIKMTFGKIGTLHKEAIKEEGNGIWLEQKVDAMVQKDVTQALLDRDSGKVLKLIHNGKEEAVPNEAPEIISQDYTEVTVPAGTFKATHIVAKTKQVSHLEMWINMKEVALDGAIKQSLTTQFGEVTLELTKQTRN